MSETPFKIRVRKGNVEIEIQGSEEFVTKKFAELEEYLEQIIPPAEEKEKIDEEIEEELPDTLPEFLYQKGDPQRFVEKTLVFVYWLKYKKQIDPFNFSDIEECYEESMIPKSKNISRDLRNIIREGLIMRLDEKKEGQIAYRLTRSGIRTIEEMDL